VEVSRALYEQLKNSNFSVAGVEQKGEIWLDDGIKLFGRIDRVDNCGEMVRIIDYKTGSIDSAASSYYMGQKLQLPLYLLTASKGKRAVGAYYFPAQIEYRDEDDGEFRMKGFMDGCEEVVKNSDTTLKDKQKSNYFDAYLNGRKVESAMTTLDFADFLTYSTLVSRKGAKELMGGNVMPSPAEGACKSCKFFGCCGFTVGTDGEERKALKVNCSKIASIVRIERGDEK
jgi:ATP-dependent helicase/DNAse subunit B